MRLVIQRVGKASVSINGATYAEIKKGLLLFLAISPDDSQDDITYAIKKVVNLRIFSDKDGKMNRSVKEIAGEVLSISQFTLFASTKKGNRPSFTKAAKPEKARLLYDQFNHLLAKEIQTKTGVFGADMQIDLLNDGPVTIVIDTKQKE